MRLSIASLTIIPIVPLVIPSPELPVWLLDYSHRCDCPSNTTATSPILWRQLCWKLCHFYICFSQSSLASDVTTPPKPYQNQLYLHAAIRNPCPLTSCLDSIPHEWQLLPLNMLLFPWLLLLSPGFIYSLAVLSPVSDIQGLLRDPCKAFFISLKNSQSDLIHCYDFKCYLY